MKKIVRKCIAEFFGTMLLTFIACGVAVTTSSLIATAFAFGLVLMAMIYTIGDISGCHINPAVSFGLFMAGKMKVSDLWKYIVAQVAGAFFGSLLLGICLTNFDSLGANLCGDTNCFIALLVELILTFIFVTVILAVTGKKNSDGHANGIIIGLTLTLVHLFGIYFTGTSVNPARSIGPALLQWSEPIPILQVWIFIIGPMAGACLAGLFYKFVLEEK